MTIGTPTTDADLPAPDGYTDCPKCWTMSVEGIDTGTGDMTDDGCQWLEGDFELCFDPCKSKGGTLWWDGGCTTLKSVGAECNCCLEITVSGITGEDGCDTVNGTFVLTPVLFQCDNVGEYNLEQPWYPDYCIWSSSPDHCMTEFSENFNWGVVWDRRTTVKMRLTNGILSGLNRYYETAERLPVGESPCSGSYTLTLNDATGLPCGNWPTEIEVSPVACDIEPTTADIPISLVDRFRSKWTLLYDTASQYWTLRSFNSVGHPIYQLYDETPCDGTPKVLERVTPFGDSGCEVSPETITITPGVPGTDCLSCETAPDPGCSVSLYRYCGGDSYQMRTPAKLSAVNDENTYDSSLGEMPTGKGCCNIGYAYDPVTGCCPTTKQEFIGYVDPWKAPQNLPEVTWELNVVMVPAVLTGMFREGNVTYIADSDIRCKGPTHFTQTASSLPDHVPRLPMTCCIVPDDFVTCNVRIGQPEGGDDSPQQNAGYDATTGQEDFCACGDTCEPTITGTIVVVDDTGAECATGSVCFTRQSTVAPQDESAATVYPRIGCLEVDDGVQTNVLTQVVYCVGGSRWASDWYCTPNSSLACDPCSSFVGTFLGTSYAERGDPCGPWPLFELPDPLEATNLCVCALPPIETDCCPDDAIPQTLTATDGTDTHEIVWNGGSWEVTGQLLGCTDKWLMACTFAPEFTMSTGSLGGCPGVAVSASVISCNPFEIEFVFTGALTGTITVTE